MATQEELEQKLWKALKSDRTVMLGLDGEGGHTRPMTVQVDEERSPLWVFTSRDNQMFQQLGTHNRAIAGFSSKGHDLFASIHGNLVENTDPAMVEKLWNPFVAAWYEGKDDPKLVLLRFDVEDAEVWLNGSSLVAGVKMLMGIDPKQDYKDKVGDVDLR